MGRDVSPPVSGEPALPLRGARLLLRLTGRPDLRGRAGSVSEGRLELDLESAPEAFAPSGIPGFVEFVAAEGVCQLPGVAVARGPGAVVFEHSGGVELLRRRAFVRAPLELAMTLTRVEQGGLALAVCTIDVSGGGLLVADSGQLELGELLEFTLELGSDPPVRGQCRPVRRTSDGRLGLAFTELDPADRDRIVHRVFARQRELRGG